MGDLTDWATRVNTFGAAGKPCFLLVDFELRRPEVWSLAELAGAGLRFSFPGYPDSGEIAPAAAPLPSLKTYPLPYNNYLRAFEIVQSGLRRGDSFLTNLTFGVRLRQVLDLGDVYARAEAKYRVLYDPHFVCFSPETFVTIDAGGYVESRPMKGTAPDTAAGRSGLLRNPKEIAEHATIVDLIRNDLSQVARRVRVTDYRYLRAIETATGGLVQTSSKIGGELPHDWPGRLGDILLRLLPAGSVSGAPKPATLNLIRQAERQDRGYYCGIAGYFDGRTFDSCVLIRFIEQLNGEYVFRAGGGITAQSRPEEEYRELLAKVRVPHFT